uniref:Uncharacterized protein n=1 Tax=viral metagenome TaxID=1070528 RepID=A0A6M3K9Q1_9ZZZZ
MHSIDIATRGRAGPNNALGRATLGFVRSVARAVGGYVLQLREEALLIPVRFSVLGKYSSTAILAFVVSLSRLVEAKLQAALIGAFQEVHSIKTTVQTVFAESRTVLLHAPMSFFTRILEARTRRIESKPTRIVAKERKLNIKESSFSVGDNNV